MLCRDPHIRGRMAFSCGRCVPCRMAKRKTWQNRIMLESYQHPHNSFCTLTYRNEDLPLCGSGRTTLHPPDLRNFLARLRSRVFELNGPRLRFYAIGEYGDQTERPHYHVALFNFQSCLNGRTKRDTTSNRSVWADCCSRCKLVGEAWKHGDIECGTLAAASARYISGYLEKKMTRFDDLRLDGRHPEFARMSLKPGVGFGAMKKIAEQLIRYDLDETELDVPTQLRTSGRLLPLGRYLRRSLRQFIGKEANAPLEAIEAIAAEMQALHADIENLPSDARRAAFKEIITSLDAGKVAGMLARAEIFRQRKRL